MNEHKDQQAQPADSEAQPQAPAEEGQGMGSMAALAMGGASAEGHGMGSAMGQITMSRDTEGDAFVPPLSRRALFDFVRSG